MDRKLFAKVGAVIALGIVFFCGRLWQPERQVRLHQQNMMKAVESRDWGRVNLFIADNYSDRWHHDKAFLLEQSQQVFRQFLAVTIQLEEKELRMEEGGGTLIGGLTITGTGSPVAQMVVTGIKALNEPFTFRWQKTGWKPWSWRLVQIDHPRLNIPDL